MEKRTDWKSFGDTAPHDARVAYFTMEAGIEHDLPTYSGGLGVLAGDALRTAADLELPLVAVTLCYTSGYFFQVIDPEGKQAEKKIEWDFGSILREVTRDGGPVSITLPIEDSSFQVKAWEYDVVGQSGYIVKVFLLDSDVEGNAKWQRQLTHVLYDYTPYYRAAQEYILGVGGVRMLRELGYDAIETFHLNEGHASMLALELAREFDGDLDKVRQQCVFTTHTPVPAGHDKFSYEVINKILAQYETPDLAPLAGRHIYNASRLAANTSRNINAVSRRHCKTSRDIFPGMDLHHITNGIHHRFWASEPIQEVFTKHLPGWRWNPRILARAPEIDDEDLWHAHYTNKKRLVDYERSHHWVLLDEDLLTVVFARRITTYKQPLLLFQDLERLATLSRDKVQYVFAGKSHPKDTGAKRLIQEIAKFSQHLWDSYNVRVVFLANYDMDLARLLVCSGDLWLNTPRRYLEASGTSGMKAALNGLLNFSVLDGWWIEGYEQEPRAGWPIGPTPGEIEGDEAVKKDDAVRDSAAIYDTLEDAIIPLFYESQNEWIDRMRRAIKLAAWFNTERMMMEYCQHAYGLELQPRWRARRSGPISAEEDPSG